MTESESERVEMKRSIEVVEDLDASDPEWQFRSTATMLDTLTAPMLSRFRREIRTRYQSHAPRLLCGKCGKPVYVSLAGTGSPGERDGRHAFFAHHAGTADACEWGTTSENPRDIDRRKFGGSQEGALHQKLKMMLADMLEADAAFSGVEVERVISKPPEWRKPDVVACLMDGQVAFDLQLATTQLPAIVSREAFYEGHGIRYVWVTSSNDPTNLARQAFQDIYWNNDAQIFAIDDRAKAATRESGELHLWVLRITPRLDAGGVRAVWARRLVSRREIDWATPSLRPRYPEDGFEAAFRKLVSTTFDDPRKRLVHAVGRTDRQAQADAAEAWDVIARATGAPLWHEAEDDRPFKALGVLASAAAGKKMDASGYAADAMTALFNQFLETQACRGWTTALCDVAEAYGHAALLGADTTRRKIARNRAETHPDLQRRYGAILDVIFPKTALARLTGPPTEIEDA